MPNTSRHTLLSVNGSLPLGTPRGHLPIVRLIKSRSLLTGLAASSDFPYFEQSLSVSGLTKQKSKRLIWGRLQESGGQVTLFPAAGPRGEPVEIVPAFEKPRLQHSRTSKRRRCLCFGGREPQRGDSRPVLFPFCGCRLGGSRPWPRGRAFW